MIEEMVRFPVKCPKCGREQVAIYRISELATAFLKHRPIRLHTVCHRHWWDASFHERQQIQEYLEARMMDFEPKRNNERDGEAHPR